MLTEQDCTLELMLKLFKNPECMLMLKTKEDTVTLTSLELNIIRLVCEENSDEEIAQKLGMQKGTAENHRNNIIKKMKVRNSVGILFFAIRHGIFRI